MPTVNFINYRQTKLNFILTGCLLMFSTITYAELGNKPVTFTIEPFPPLHFFKDDGSITGIHANLGNEIFKRAGINVKYTHYPYARVQLMIKEGKIALFQWGERGVEGEKEQLLLPIPYVTVRLHAYFKDESLGITADPTSFQGKSFVIMRGWPLGPYAAVLNADNKGLKKFQQASTAKNAVKMLFANRMDSLVTFQGPFELLVGKMGLPRQEVKSVQLFEMQGYSFAIPKTFPHAQELHDRMKAEYEKMVQEGLVNETFVSLKSDNIEDYI